MRTNKTLHLHPIGALCVAALALLGRGCGAPDEEQAPGDSLGASRSALTLTITAKVGTQTTGRLSTFLTTTVQPQEDTINFFVNHPQGKTQLANMNPQRIHIQPHSIAIPLQAPNTWDFTTVDKLVQPILAIGDKSPQYHALAPGFMLDCTSGCTLPTSSFPAYTTYLQDLVRYYNAGGFTVNGHHYQSPSTTHIPYWAIYDEPNINGFDGARYAQLYNTVVPAMKAVDPTIKIVAMEVDDFDGSDFSSFYTAFAKNVNLANAPADALGIHFYASCNQLDTDQDILWETPVLVSHLQKFRGLLQGTGLASVPFWLTENNVNADFSVNGYSNCQPGRPFVLDKRGTSAFFAGWRPYTFSQVAQSGASVAGFFQFQFPADAQYAEADSGTGNLYLSYWVDLWLSRYLGYRLDTGKGANLLSVQNSDPGDVEVLAARRDADGSTVVMIANHALASTTDDNGAGLPVSVTVDLSAFPLFHSATRLTIDKNTSLTAGPTPVTVTPATRMTVTLGGYGVVFLSLL